MEKHIFPQYITVMSNAWSGNSSLLDTISSKHSFANRPKQPYSSRHSKFSKVCRDFHARLNPTNLHVAPQSDKGCLHECLHFGMQTWIGTQLASKSPSLKAGPKALKHVFIDFSDMHSPRNQRLKSVKGSKIYSKRFGFCGGTTGECSGSCVWTPRTVLCFCSHPSIYSLRLVEAESIAGGNIKETVFGIEYKWQCQFVFNLVYLQ